MDKRIVCKYCGEMMDAGDGFCPVCGAVNRISAKQDPDKEYCRFCGGELGGSEGFCKICGTPVKRRAENEGLSAVSEDPDRNKETDLSLTEESDGDAAAVLPSEPSEGSEETAEDEPLNFIQKAEKKQQENKALEEQYEKERIEAAKALSRESEKLRAAAAQATRPYGDGIRIAGAGAQDLQVTRSYDGDVRKAGAESRNVQATRAYGDGIRKDGAGAQDLQVTRSYDGDVRKAGAESRNVQETRAYGDDIRIAGAHTGKKRAEGAFETDEDIAGLESKAAQAGVSVEEIKLFEQAKASFESDNETYPDDYNVNDYDHFDYSRSRYGAYNMGSLDMETIEYQNRNQTREEAAKADIARDKKEPDHADIGPIGTKKKKTPMHVRVMVFFAAIFLVAGFAAIILYIVPMMKNVHPQEMLLDESVQTAELTITPLAIATSTPTPTPSPTATPTPFPMPEGGSMEPPAPVPGVPEATEVGSQPSSPPSGYLVADSDSRIMDPSELDGRSPEEIQLIANEIYARYGYAFEEGYLSEYFSQFDWYDPSVPPAEFSDEMLSEEAQANLNMIARYQAEHE